MSTENPNQNSEDSEKKNPTWLEQFPELNFSTYYEKWRKRLQSVSDRAREKGLVESIFSDQSFETGHGLKLILRLFTPLTLVLFGFSFIWDPYQILRTCSIAGLIGFATNWIAVKMLFRPRQPRPVFGQGLIPAQRQEILKKVADEICEKLVNEQKIRQEIEEKEIVRRLTNEALTQFKHFVRSQEFVSDTKAMILTTVAKLVENPEFRDRVESTVEMRVSEVAGQRFTNWLVGKIRGTWKKPLSRIVDGELNVLPDTIDHILSEFDTVVDRIPGVLEKRQEIIEQTLTRLVITFVNEIDVRAMLEKQLNTVTPEELEKSFNEFADDKLSYITLLGGILGFIGGFIILWPIHTILIIILTFCFLAMLDTILHYRKRNQRNSP